MVAALGGLASRRALAADGELNILNCNVAWSTGLEGPVAEAYELANPEYALPEVSRTFHARDLFAPAAAHIARGATGFLL